MLEQIVLDDLLQPLERVAGACLGIMLCATDPHYLWLRNGRLELISYPGIRPEDEDLGFPYVFQPVRAMKAALHEAF